MLNLTGKELMFKFEENKPKKIYLQNGLKVSEKDFPFVTDGINPNDNFMKGKTIYNKDIEGIVVGFRLAGIEPKRTRFGEYYFIVKKLISVDNDGNKYYSSTYTNWWATVKNGRNDNIRFQNEKDTNLYRLINFDYQKHRINEMYNLSLNLFKG